MASAPRHRSNFLFAIGCHLMSHATASDLLDLKDTFVVTAEKTRNIDSVSPNRGTAAGGTRVHIYGEGFATEFYSGANSVYIGKASKSWVQCDVIEGACTVDCGGGTKIVCDTQEWISDAASGWLDIWVIVDDSIASYDLIKQSAFYYQPTSHHQSPKMTEVWPRHASAGDIVLMRGEALGTSVADYRMIYVGPGRPPQSGNVNDGTSASTTTHAVCRADDLNMAANPDTGEVDSFSLPIMVEDAVIGELQATCASDTHQTYLITTHFLLQRHRPRLTNYREPSLLLSWRLHGRLL